MEVPFREDLKRFTFPPLERVVNREGKELEEHASLPSKEMQACMDEMVDSMNLMDAAGDDDGEGSPWFRCEDSFNPAIHLTKDAVSWRVFHPEDKSLPQPHPEVVKFLTMPDRIAKRSEVLGKRCRDVFDLKDCEFAQGLLGRGRGGRALTHRADFPIDKKKEARRQAIERARERGDEAASGEGKELNLEGAMDDEVAAEAASLAPRPLDGGSDTEEEHDEVPSVSDAQVGSKAPVSIAEFESRLADRAYQVEEVIDSMGTAITAKVTTSFASNGYVEARDMIKAMRKGAIDYEEAERFNAFLRSFKAHVLDDSLPRSRADFWDTFMRGRDDLGLITDDEADGEPTGVGKSAAAEFINL